jgi:hypothetical protein
LDDIKLTDGHTDTMSLTPMALSSSTIAPGSGHSLGSKRQSPSWVQWKKSTTMTESGSPRRWYSLATSSSSSWVR